MKTFVPAFLERALPRAFSAAMLLVLAALTSPTQVGVYNMVTLLYTFVSALSDTAVRQILIRVVTEDGGLTFLAKYAKVIPALAALVIGGFIVALKFSNVIQTWGTAIGLMPFAVTPLLITLSLRWVGVLQATGNWQTLARGQLFASLVSVLVGLPVLLLTHSVLGPALQTLVAEGFFAWFVFRSARHMTPPDIPGIDTSLKRDMATMSTFSALTWLQTQMERVLLGVFAGAAVLGTYSTASAIARAPGDALSESTANVTRSHLAGRSDPVDIRAAAEATLIKSLVLAFGAALSAVLLALVLRHILSAQWDESLAIVPVLALTAFPALLGRSASVIQIQAGRSNRSLWAPLVGVVFAIFIALAAVHSLAVAAAVVVVRELAVATVGFLMVPKMAPWRAYGVCWAAVLVSAVPAFWLST